MVKQVDDKFTIDIDGVPLKPTMCDWSESGRVQSDDVCRRADYLHNKRVQLVFDSEIEPSMTRQSFKEQCDVNNIMKRYSKTGVLDHVKTKPPMYGDYTNVVDYHTALNIVDQAMQAFSELPSSVRTRFQNNPGLFEQFCNDPSNRDELIKLGLIEVPRVKESGVRPDSESKPE